MYTTRAKLVTPNSLRNIFQVCKIRTPNSFSSIRNISTATQRSDFYTTHDDKIAETQLGLNHFTQNGIFQSKGQNPDRVYGQSSDSYNALGGIRNSTDYGYGNGNGSSQFSNNSLVGFEGSRGSSGFDGQNGSFRGSGNGYTQQGSGNGNGSSQFSNNRLVGFEENRSSGFDGQNGSFSRSGNGYTQQDCGNGNGNSQFSNNSLVGFEESRRSSGFDGQNGSFSRSGNGYTQQDSGNGNGDSQFSNNRLVGFEENRRSSGFDGQNGSFSDSSNGYTGRPADFRVENTGMYQPSLHNGGTYQHNDNNGIRYSNEGTYNVGSVGVDEGNRVERRVEDLDELIKGCKVKEAVEFVKLLDQDGLQVDVTRYIGLMELCGEYEALEEAKTVHGVLKSMPSVDISMSNKILEMYCKCGSVVDAFAVFDKMPQRNLTSWDVMITGLAKNGLGENAIELFDEFKESGRKPDAQIFIGVFNACGVLCNKMLHFESMRNDYGIVPSMEHYVGMVDMFGTAGSLDEALEFVENMPLEPSVDVWETLMKFCRIHGNAELGDRCAEKVQLLDSSRLNDQSKGGLLPINSSDIEKEKAKQKLSGQNLLEVRNRVHEYRAGDKSHPDHEKTYALLRGLKQHLKEEGYVPETKFVLHDVDDESKEEALMSHSERLAAAKGFMTSAARADLRIIKNLRVCGDCHKAFKMISKIVGRAIIARDTKRFHRFENGSCNCNDFW